MYDEARHGEEKRRGNRLGMGGNIDACVNGEAMGCEKARARAMMSIFVRFRNGACPNTRGVK
jgi:hypothetical protein